jgi:hypothetical protein
MWDEVRSNGIIQVQHYKPEGTVLGGLFNSFRSLYSEAPTYRLIAINQPFWEYANGHVQEGVEMLMDWMEKNVLAKLSQLNVGKYNEGDVDVKIRIITDFMSSFVPIFGTLHKLPLSDDQFNSVIRHMAEAPNLGNSQYKVAIVHKNPTAPPAASTGPPKVVIQPNGTQVLKFVAPPVAVAPQPFSGSQLVTRYERDPTTGMIRQVQVYQPVAPQFYQQPMAVSYIPPSPSNNYHHPSGVGQSVQYNAPRAPSNAVVYQHSRSASSGSSPSYAPPVPQSGGFVYPPPANGPPQSKAPQQPQQKPMYGSPAAPAKPNPYVVPSNPYVKPPPTVANPPAMQYAPLAQLPVSEWDAPPKEQNALQQSYASPAPVRPQSAPVMPSEASALATAPAPSPPLGSEEESTSQLGTAASSASAPSSGPSSSSAPKPESDADEDRNLCKLCFERELDCALLPCSHVACYQCATSLKLTKCPFCRQDITQVLKLFRA